jgi:hypothetical protein
VPKRGARREIATGKGRDFAAPIGAPRREKDRAPTDGQDISWTGVDRGETGPGREQDVSRGGGAAHWRSGHRRPLVHAQSQKGNVCPPHIDPAACRGIATSRRRIVGGQSNIEIAQRAAADGGVGFGWGWSTTAIIDDQRRCVPQHCALAKPLMAMSPPEAWTTELPPRGPPFAIQTLCRDHRGG